MTDKEKLERMKKLADGMYYAAKYLTTDASRLRKAMDEYQKFIIYEYNKQEPASEELEQASKEWLRPQLDKSYANYGERKMMDLTRFDGYAMLDAIEFGAQWQKEQMMKDAISGIIFGNRYFRQKNISLTNLSEEQYDKLQDFGERVKVIIIKE